MFYRENGQFKTSYRADQQILPIRQDRIALGLILLVAMIGAIVLTHRPARGTRGQNISQQNQRRPEDSVRNVNQPSGQGVEI